MKHILMIYIPTWILKTHCAKDATHERIRSHTNFWSRPNKFAVMESDQQFPRTGGGGIERKRA